MSINAIIVLWWKRYFYRVNQKKLYICPSHTLGMYVTLYKQRHWRWFNNVIDVETTSSTFI